MERIKCPKCKSTTQIELMWEDRCSYGTTKTKEYSCGCGCDFEVIFEVAKVNILNKE